jgi:hypothetical protein
VLSEQFARTEWISARRAKPWAGEQLSLAFPEQWITRNG